MSVEMGAYLVLLLLGVCGTSAAFAIEEAEIRHQRQRAERYKARLRRMR